MFQKNEKSRQILIKILSKFCDKRYIRHLLLMLFLALITGAALSMLISRSVTVNDTIIRYTEPPSEELDTEGYEEGEGGEAGVEGGETSAEDSEAGVEGGAEPETAEGGEGGAAEPEAAQGNEGGAAEPEAAQGNEGGVAEPEAQPEE